MTNDAIDRIKALFDRNGITHGTDRFRLYIHAVIAKSVFSDNSSAQFSDYLGAWNSPRAEGFKKYLSGVPSEEESVLLELCEYIRDSNVIEFICFVTPDLFVGDISNLFDYLNKIQIDNRTVYNLIKLFALSRYRAYLFGLEYPSSFSRLSSEKLLMLVESSFDGWRYGKLFSQLPHFREEIQDLWLLAFGAPFAPEKVKSTGVAGIMKELSELGLSEDVALDLFYICKTANSFDLRKIDKPFSYLRKALTTRVDDDFYVESDDFGDELISPGEGFYLREDMFNKILRKWKSIDTVDFVRSILFTEYSKNLCAENSLAMPYFFKHCNQANGVIVFDASPDFILRVSKLESSAADILFIQSTKRLAMLYKQRFPGLNFAFYQSKGEKETVFVQVDIEEEYEGKELRFVSQPVSKVYGAAIVFARCESEPLLGKIVNALADKIDTKNGFVYLFCPNSLLDTEGRSIRTDLTKEYDFSWIQILPTETSSAWLKKNTIACLARKKESGLEDLKLIRTDLYDSPVNKDLKLICQDPWPVKIPQNIFLGGQHTVNHLWEEFRPKSEKEKERTTREWKFTAEISLWYSWSNKRGRVQYHSVPTAKQLAINPLQRGQRMMPAHAYSAKTIERAEKMFAERIWTNDFKSFIVEDIKRAYKSRPITLKTFWYCHEDELKGKTGYSFEAATKLFESQEISNLLSDGEYSLETYQTMVEQVLISENKKDQIKIWRTLNAIISFANQSGRFLPNTISDYVRSLVEKDRGYQQVRKSLAKRSYEMEEEREMLSLLHRNLPENGAFVGAAISFYCGIVLRQICALTWRDYHKLFGTEAGQLLITKTITNADEVKSLGVDDRNMLRRVPIVKELTEILDARLEYVRNKWQTESGDVSEDEIMVLPIVSKEDLKSRCTPGDIKLAKDQMEAAAGIEPMEVSISKVGAKVTDLNEYSGDRFRSNFFYRMLQTCNMSRAEANYIYGVSLPTTFSKHYCDYTSDFAQVMLCQKLERWTSMHREKHRKEGVIENRISSVGRRIRIDQKAFHRFAVELRMNVRAEGITEDCRELIVTVNDDRGVNLTIRKQG